MVVLSPRLLGLAVLVCAMIARAASTGYGAVAVDSRVASGSGDEAAVGCPALLGDGLNLGDVGSGSLLYAAGHVRSGPLQTAFAELQDWVSDEWFEGSSAQWYMTVGLWPGCDGLPGAIAPEEPAGEPDRPLKNDGLPRLTNPCTSDFAPQNVLTSAGVASSLCAAKFENTCDIRLTLTGRFFDRRSVLSSGPPGEVATPPPESG